MNFRCVLFVLCLMAGVGTASGASSSFGCESATSNDAFNACLIKSLSADFFTPKIDNGHWVYSIHPNVDGRKRSTFVATLLSSSKIHYLDKPVAMTVRCNKRKTELEIHWDGVKIREGEVDITYHLDKGAKQTAKWPLSVTEQSVFVSNPVPFLHKLAKSKTFRVQITSANSPSISATFYLDGLANLMPAMKGACY